MGRDTTYEPGGHWAVCDICGLTYRHYELKKNSDGLLVCKVDWEPRHPQESIRAKQDKIRPDAKVRPSTEDEFSFHNCQSHSAVPGWAVPGCCTPGNTTEPIAAVPAGTFNNGL